MCPADPQNFDKIFRFGFFRDAFLSPRTKQACVWRGGFGMHFLELYDVTK